MNIYSPRFRRKVLDFRWAGCENGLITGKTPVHSFRSTARHFRLPSHTLVSVWQNQPNDAPSISTRLERRGRKRKLSDTDFEDLGAWVKKRHQLHRPTKGVDVIKKVRLMTRNKVILSKQDVSNYMKALSFSSRKTQRRAPHKDTAEFKAQIDKFRAYTNNRRFPCKRIVVMDEAGLYDNEIVSKSYVPKGSHDVYVSAKEKGKRDTIVVAVRGNGDKLPLFFIEHQRQKSKNGRVVQKKVAGLTKELMQQYLDDVLIPNLHEGDLVLMDRLSSHTNNTVREKITSKGAELQLFPPAGASELSPLDNALFHTLRDYYRKKSGKETPEGKKRAIETALKKVLKKSIRGFFRKCKIGNRK